MTYMQVLYYTYAYTVCVYYIYLGLNISATVRENID